MGLTKPQSLEERRTSLDAWQHKEKYKFNLDEFAKAGFFFEQSFDIHDDPGRLRCAFCLSVIGNWQPEDDPWKEHILSVNYCPHVVQCKGEEFVERMLQEESDIESENDTELEWAIDETCHFGLFGFPPSILTCNEQNANRSPTRRGDIFNKDMNIADHRVKSFSGVQTNAGSLSNSPAFFSQLADSGFYFEGLDTLGLRVRCFRCGLYLCNIDNKEDVWRTHAQNSDCEHVKRRKGVEFISQVRAQTREKIKPLEVLRQIQKLLNSQLCHPQLIAQILPSKTHRTTDCIQTGIGTEDVCSLLIGEHKDSRERKYLVTRVAIIDNSRPGPATATGEEESYSFVASLNGVGVGVTGVSVHFVCKIDKFTMVF